MPLRIGLPGTGGAIHAVTAGMCGRDGRATSLLATVSYLGFLLGPVYVGLWADAAGLRGAMIAVAALGVVLLLLAPMMLSRTARMSVQASAQASAAQGNG